MKNTIDLPGAVLVAALLLAGVGALAFKETNLGTTLLGLAIGLVMPSPMKPGGPGSNGAGGAALALVVGLVTLQGCTDTTMPAGLSLILGVLGALVLTLSHAKALLTRLIAGAMLMLAVGCGVHPSVPAYGVVATACIAQERIIIAREGSSREDDERDIATTRTVCDAILERIESEVTQ